MSNVIINLSIEPDLKSQAEEVFANQGLSLVEAIKIFLRESVLEYGMPFRPGQPAFNKETYEAMQETEDILSGKIPAKRYTSVEEMIRDIMAEDDDA